MQFKTRRQPCRALKLTAPRKPSWVGKYHHHWAPMSERAGVGWGERDRDRQRDK